MLIVVVQITDHASANKLPLAVVPDHRQVLLIGQFLWQSDDHSPGSLSISSFFGSVHCIPERLGVSICARCIVWQHDFPIRAAVGMLPFVIVLGVHLFSGVVGCCCHDGLITPAYV